MKNRKRNLFILVFILVLVFSTTCYAAWSKQYEVVNTTVHYTPPSH